ncbi:hypothetical protein C8Q75DRAFT_513238 [Abortiporus biennis]|nr:hypothetical protein C8Q75DRAFT_513238 [Abortiporus biennis]
MHHNPSDISSICWMKHLQFQTVERCRHRSSIPLPIYRIECMLDHLIRASSGSVGSASVSANDIAMAAPQTAAIHTPIDIEGYRDGPFRAAIERTLELSRTQNESTSVAARRSELQVQSRYLPRRPSTTRPLAILQEDRAPSVASDARSIVNDYSSDNQTPTSDEPHSLPLPSTSSRQSPIPLRPRYHSHSITSQFHEYRPLMPPLVSFGQHQHRSASVVAGPRDRDGRDRERDSREQLRDAIARRSRLAPDSWLFEMSARRSEDDPISGSRAFEHSMTGRRQVTRSRINHPSLGASSSSPGSATHTSIVPTNTELGGASGNANSNWGDVDREDESNSDSRMRQRVEESRARARRYLARQGSTPPPTTSTTSTTALQPGGLPTSRGPSRATPMGAAIDMLGGGQHQSRANRSLFRRRRAALDESLGDELPVFSRVWSRSQHRNLGDYVRDEDLDTSYEGLLRLSTLLGEARPRGLSQASMDRLPSGVYREWMIAGETEARCPICLDDYEQTDPVLKVPACSHWFHKECLQVSKTLITWSSDTHII